MAGTNLTRAEKLFGLFAGLFVLFHLAAFLVLSHRPNLVTVLGNISHLVPVLLAGIFCAAAAWRREGSPRVFWLFLTIGLWLYLVGMLYWFVWEVILHRPLPNPWPMQETPVFLHSLFFLGAALWNPQRKRNLLDVYRNAIDFSLVFVAVIFVYLYSVISFEIVTQNSPSYSSNWNKVYDIENLTLVLAFAFLAWKSSYLWRRVYSLLAVGGAWHLVGAALANRAIDLHRYRTGSVYELGLIPPYFFFCFAAFHFLQHPELIKEAEPRKLSLGKVTYSGLGQLFTWLSILLIPATDLLVRHYSSHPPALRAFRTDLTLITVLVVTTLAAMRHGLVQRENRRLFGALTRSESKYKFLVEASHDLVYRTSARGEWEFVNDVCQQLFGYSKREMLGRHFTEFIHPEDRPAAVEIHRQVENGKSIRSYENRILCKDGTVRHMSWNASPILDAQGQFLGCHGMSRDVSLTRKLQDELNQKAHNLEKAYAELQAAQQHLLQSERMAAVGQLVSGIAHELNNPLTAVLGFSEMLLSNPGVDHSAKSKLTKVFDSAKRTQNIVNNLLRFARQEKPSRQPVDVNELVQRTIALREYDLRVSNVKVEFRGDTKLPLTLGDPHQLSQVFLNIINNAYDAIVEFRRDGHLVISTRCSEKWIEIVFADDGPGMREPGRVFEPFYTTKDIGRGTGLGLSICYGIVKEHGGEISARNHQGGGATFSIRLPVTAVPAVAHEVATAAATAKPGVRSALVVDDEESVVDLQRHILEELEMAVSTAKDGKEALGRLAADSFDLIILDLKMPGGISGRDVYEWLQENRPGKEKAVLFITGDVVNHETAQFLSQASVQALTKPFALEEYRKAVAKVLLIPGPAVILPGRPHAI